MSMLFKRIKDWAVSITSFRTGDVIPVDGPNGTAKMGKDDLLRETAQNTDTAMSEKYDLESIDFGKEKSVEITATSGSSVSRFDLFTLSLNVGDKYLIKLNESTNCVSSFAIGSFGDNNTWTTNSAYVPADGEWHEVTITKTNTYDGKCGIYVSPDRVIGDGTVSMEICTKYENTLLYKIALEKDRIDELNKVDYSLISKTYDHSFNVSAHSGQILVAFNMFSHSLRVGEKVLVRLNESTNCVSSFAIGSFGDNNTWTINSAYVPADGEWHEVTITKTNTYDGKCGIYVSPDRVIGDGTVSMDVRFDYQLTLQSRFEMIEPKVNAASLEEITIETLSTPEKNLTNNTQSLEFELISGRLRTGDIVKIRMIDESEKVSSFSLGSFGASGSWTHNSNYVPADGEWHEVTITADNSYNDKFGWWISQEKINGDCTVRMEIQINYGATLMGRVGKNEKDIENLKLSTLIKQFDGVLKTDESTPLTSISESGGFASIFENFCFCGDSVCSGTVAYNDGTWHYPNLYATSWGQYMCRTIGSKGVNLSYAGVQTSDWINSYITLNSTGYDPDDIGSRLLDSPKKAYIIALGINDANAGVMVGDVDTDIDMDNPENYAHTFAGQYGYIIQKIKEVQPSAKIFVVTLPAIWQSQAESLGYNDVIRAMATKFTNVFVVDFQAYLPVGTKINSDYVYQGHMTTQGYKWIAEAMATYIDYIVRKNPSSFKNVALIGHSSDHGQY